MVQILENKFDKMKEEVQKYFEGTNSCHGFDHVERVLNLSLKIAEKENADLDILKLSALLHDVGRKIQDESGGKINHVDKSIEIAENLLREYGFEEDVISKVIHCIDSHRFRGEKIPDTIEAKILFDADKLDAIGAIGIGRAFSFAGHFGAKVHNPNIVADSKHEYTIEDTAYHEFLIKLNKIKDRLFTEEGKRIAEERHKFMEEFFDRLNKEYTGDL